MNHFIKDMTGIYQITSPTGKVYIGQSWNIEKRLLCYKRLDCKDQPKIYRSLIKHGASNHIFETLRGLPPITTQKELDWWEVRLIGTYKSFGVDMLNIREGGLGGRMSDETKKLLSDSKKGISRPFYLGENNPYYGKKHSDEVRSKMSKSNKGKKLGALNGRARRIRQFNLNGGLIKEWETIIEAAKFYGKSRQGINDAVSGRNKTAFGFKWRYSA